MVDMMQKRPDNSYGSSLGSSDVESQRHNYEAIPRDDHQNLDDETNGMFVPPPKKKSLRWLYWLLTFLFFVPMLYLFTVAIPQSSVYTPVPDLVRVEQLSHPEFHKGSRLVIVGDVHGSYKQLRKLLKKLKFSEKKDKLLLLGDFITKGPRSMEVLEYAMKINASCVRGNHEDKIISLYADSHNLPKPKTKPPQVPTEAVDPSWSAPMDIPTDIASAYSNEEPGIEGDDEWTTKYDFDQTDDVKLVKHLTPQHMEFLGKCPAIMSLGPISETGLKSYGVHGGLDFNVANLQLQDPELVMFIRSMLPPDYTEWSEEDDGVPWSDLWNERQLELPKEDRRVVFYGHDARSGLNFKEYTKGLDSACVRGFRLSAYVVSLKKKKFSHEFVSVKC